MVAGGEEPAADYDPVRQQGDPGRQELMDEETAPFNPMTPEQIQALLYAAMENMNPIKGPVKK